MKPTLEEIIDNYERVLLRLHSGELAGIVKNKQSRLQVLRKTHWIDKAITTSDLDKSYNRTTVAEFNIDAIAFLSNKSEVSDAIEFGCDEDIDWDWDINNSHNLKFKKGDVVIIDHAENRSAYVRMLGKVGTIVDAEYKRYIDAERITYSVRVDDSPNEYQENGLWIFHKEKSLKLYEEDPSIIQLRQMSGYIDDCIAQAVVNKETTINTFNIKGDNKTINNILDIYGERKREKINRKYDDMENIIKQSDPRYKVWRECVDKLNELYSEDKILTTDHFAPIKLSENTIKKLDDNETLRCNELGDLSDKLNEVQAQLSMCETYDQKQEILRRYNIINKNGKVNG